MGYVHPQQPGPGHVVQTVRTVHVSCLAHSVQLFKESQFTVSNFLRQVPTGGEAGQSTSKLKNIKTKIRKNDEFLSLYVDRHEMLLKITHVRGQGMVFGNWSDSSFETGSF
jgi:hypothetical protein